MAMVDEDVNNWFPLELLRMDAQGEAYPIAEDPYDPDPYA